MKITLLIKLAFFTVLLFSFLSTNAEHEIGIAFGFQKSNSQRYGIKARDMVSFSYRFMRKKNSFWAKGNHGIVSTTQILPFVGVGGSISTIGVGFGYNILHAQKNKVCLGAELGAVILSDQHNVTNTREQMGLLVQYSRERIFSKHLGFQIRLERKLLGKAPLISDANPAFYDADRLLSLNAGFIYKFGFKKMPI